MERLQTIKQSKEGGGVGRRRKKRRREGGGGGGGAVAAGVRVEEWCGGVRKVRERKLEGKREAVTRCGR